MIKKGDKVLVLTGKDKKKDGEVIEINDNLSNDASIVNQDAENDGWIFKIKISNLDQYNTLMSLDQYLEFLDK